MADKSGFGNNPGKRSQTYRSIQERFEDDRRSWYVTIGNCTCISAETFLDANLKFDVTHAIIVLSSRNDVILASPQPSLLKEFL